MLLEFKKVSFSYDGKYEVLKEVSFNITKGEKVALLGLNGSGKSTLMLHINGLLLPTEGNVLVNDINTKSKSLKDIRKSVGMVFQNADDQLFMPKVRDDVAFGPINMGLDKNEVERRVNHALELTGVKDLENKSPYELSGGQKKAVSIATVLSMSPEIIVMDEPTTGMDYKAEANFISIVDDLKEALLLSTHDINLARRLCHRAIVLDKGEIIYDGIINNLVYPPVSK